MNVTIVCDVLGEPNNGTTIATMNLINSLRIKGHKVSVVCADQDKKGKEGYYVVPNLNLGRFINKLVERNDVTLAKPDKNILESAIKDADVVHIETPFMLGVAGVKMARKYNKPLTASFHCQAENFTAHIRMMNLELVNRLTYKVFYKNVFQYCDKIHYPTAFVRDIFEKVTHKTNSAVISNGVNKAFFVAPPLPRHNDKFTIVCTGRFSAEKAQHILIKAVNYSKHKDNIRIKFAGSGPDKEELIRLADKLNVDCDFNFYNRSDLIDLLHNSDLYVHTATIEIEAIACMEAIVCGLVPVICNSPKSATKQFALDDKSLFRTNDYKDLANKIDFWIDNEPIRMEYKQKYKEVVQKFDQDYCMDQMEKMLLSVANKNNG